MPYDRVCPACGEDLPDYPFENPDINDCCISFLEDYVELDEDYYDPDRCDTDELDFNDDEDY